MSNKEIRQITSQVEFRAENEDSDDYITGYALKFDRWSEVLGGGFFPFKETIKREALENTDFSDVVALFNHDRSLIMARNTVSEGEGSLSLEVDDIGLKFKFKPTNTSYAKDLMANMRSGIVNKCSFAMFLDYRDTDAVEIDWDDSDRGYDLHTIRKIERISDVSVVTEPAYQDTESVVSDRCREVKEERSNRIKENRKNEEELELQRQLIEIELENI